MNATAGKVIRSSDIFVTQKPMFIRMLALGANCAVDVA